MDQVETSRLGSGTPTAAAARRGCAQRRRSAGRPADVLGGPARVSRRRARLVADGCHRGRRAANRGRIELGKAGRRRGSSIGRRALRARAALGRGGTIRRSRSELPQGDRSRSKPRESAQQPGLHAAHAGKTGCGARVLSQGVGARSAAARGQQELRRPRRRGRRQVGNRDRRFQAADSSEPGRCRCI